MQKGRKRSRSAFDSKPAPASTSASTSTATSGSNGHRPSNGSSDYQRGRPSNGDMRNGRRNFGSYGRRGPRREEEEKKKVVDPELLAIQERKRIKKEKKMFMSSKVSKIREKPTERRVKRRRRGDDEKDDPEVELRGIAREVNDLGATGFDWKNKKKWEDLKIQQLGGMEAKSEKTSYKILVGLRKKEKEREKKKVELLKASGMYVETDKRPKAETGEDMQTFLNRLKGNRRGDFGVGDGSRGLKCSKGFFKDGILFVKPPPGTKEVPAKAKTGKGRPKWRKKGGGKKKGKGKK